LRYYLGSGTPTLFRLIVRPFLGRQAKGLARDLWRGVRQERDFRILAPLILISAVVLAALGGQIWPLFKYWLVPLFFVYPVFVFWGEFMDHWGTKTAVRTTRMPAPLQWILGPHNSTSHCAHHHWPQLPWRKLPEADRQLKDKESMELGGLLWTLH
jgi:fatty acid desaturase